MAQEKFYVVTKNKYNDRTIKIDSGKMNGFKITPKNEITYDGVVVNSLLLMKPSFVEKILKKKNKKKLEYYLQYMISLTEDDSNEDPATIAQALNDLSRYKDIIEYKYRKYLDDKYIDILLKKVNLLEHELKTKLIYKQMNAYSYVEEETKGKSR